MEKEKPLRVKLNFSIMKDDPRYKEVCKKFGELVKLLNEEGENQDVK